MNPEIGVPTSSLRWCPPPTTPKKVAVIGGGPAGMRAALYLCQRRHSVTLYEKSDKLGGRLLHTDYSSFKWPPAGKNT